MQEQMEFKVKNLQLELLNREKNYNEMFQNQPIVSSGQVGFKSLKQIPLNFNQINFKIKKK